MTVTSKFYGEKRVWFCGKESCAHSTRATARACAKRQRAKAVRKEETGTNAEFARANRKFQDACLLAGIAPTTRQASKWRMGKGLAFRFKDLPDGEAYLVLDEAGKNQGLTLLEMAYKREYDASPIFWQGKINAICLGI